MESEYQVKIRVIKVGLLFPVALEGAEFYMAHSAKEAAQKAKDNFEAEARQEGKSLHGIIFKVVDVRKV